MLQPPPFDIPLIYEAPEDDAATQSAVRNRLVALHAHRHKHHCGTLRHIYLATARRRQAALLKAMAAAGIPRSVVSATATCGRHAFVYRHSSTGEHRLRTWTCHNRFCLICQRTYLRAVRERYLAALPDPQAKLSFLTLTQRAEPGRGLRHSLTALLAAFRRLRRDPEWRSRVIGGVYVTEITRGSRQWWHVHLHLIIDTRYWPLAVLNAAWHRSARDDVYCHIQAIDDDKRHASRQYLNKYLSKPFPEEIYDNPAALTDFIASTRHRRLINTFGKWAPALKLDQVTLTQPHSADPDRWQFKGELHDLIRAAEAGNLYASRILKNLGYPPVQPRLGTANEIERHHRLLASIRPEPPPLFRQTA